MSENNLYQNYEFVPVNQVGSTSFLAPPPLRAPEYCRRPIGRVVGRQGGQTPLALSHP